ncbi:MAG: prepilin-type N-terminal cleavage/methylation domain-containing protein [Calditrichaeota bacterium]|nr:MAG: prepilin-type N-terminal cleavage/methylation domain-containing protein [Calditrichota bacterium]
MKKLTLEFETNERGFTLIETMISLAIIAVIGLASFTLVKRAVAARKTHTTVTTKLTQFSKAFSIISQDITNTKSVAYGNFSGTQDSLVLIGKTKENPADTQLQKISYRVEHSGQQDKQNLRRITRDFTGKSNSLVLLTGFEVIKFSYLQQYSDGNRWDSEWDEDGYLPLAVKLNLEDKSGTRQKELLFPVRVQRQIKL